MYCVFAIHCSGELSCINIFLPSHFLLCVWSINPFSLAFISVFCIILLFTFSFTRDKNGPTRRRTMGGACVIGFHLCLNSVCYICLSIDLKTRYCSMLSNLLPTTFLFSTIIFVPFLFMCHIFFPSLTRAHNSPFFFPPSHPSLFYTIYIHNRQSISHSLFNLLWSSYRCLCLSFLKNLRLSLPNV